eukprot:TRINITY_DN28940_c0_g1_i10.p1 TRINITY_DN28940_c0_g1~~TRINITY_DN28940_c0_g1_i10.p1  ORF type:complete len:537 (-),score=54.63 TRINITY_DN28940_c0_g1_i10:123-1682(-)
MFKFIGYPLIQSHSLQKATKTVMVVASSKYFCTQDPSKPDLTLSPKDQPLTTQISYATSIDQVFSLLKSQKTQLNADQNPEPAPYVSALTTLVKLGIHTREQQNIVKKILGEIDLDLIRQMGRRELVVCFWALSKLDIRKDYNFYHKLEQIEKGLLAIFNELDNRDLITTIHAIASVNSQNKDLIRKFVIKYCSDPDKSLIKPQSITNLMWSVAKIGDFWLLPSFKKALNQAIVKLDYFQDINLGNAMWACGEMRFYDQKFFTEAEERIISGKINLSSPSLCVQALNGFCAFGNESLRHNDVIKHLIDQILKSIDSVKMSTVVEATLQLSIYYSQEDQNIDNQIQQLLNKVVKHLDGNEVSSVNVKQNKKLQFILMILKARNLNIIIPQNLIDKYLVSESRSQAKVGQPKMKVLQEIQDSLEQLNIKSEINVPIGPRSIDVVFQIEQDQGQSVKVGVVYEGLQGYSISEPRVPMSSCLAHRKIVENQVDKVLPISFLDWAQLQSVEQRVNYLKRRLKEI